VGCYHLRISVHLATRHGTESLLFSDLFSRKQSCWRCEAKVSKGYPIFFSYGVGHIERLLVVGVYVSLAFVYCTNAAAKRVPNLFHIISHSDVFVLCHSWELGTRSQALLELNANLYSVLSDYSLPPPSTIPANLTNAMTTVLSIANNVVSNRNVSNGVITGPQPLMNDSAAGDPASIGMAVLLANWTGQGRSDGLDYAGAAQDQLNFLFQKVPKTSDGAISHRVEQLQLWFV
jgi:hypothetical protein